MMYNPGIMQFTWLCGLLAAVKHTHNMVVSLFRYIDIKNKGNEFYSVSRCVHISRTILLLFLQNRNKIIYNQKTPSMYVTFYRWGKKAGS